MDAKNYDSQSTLDLGGSATKSKLSHNIFKTINNDDDRKISVSPNQKQQFLKKKIRRQLTHGRPDQKSNLHEIESRGSKRKPTLDITSGNSKMNRKNMKTGISPNRALEAVSTNDYNRTSNAIVCM